MTERVYNFNPGPTKLPGSVLKELSKAVLEFDNSGMSILEISHRSKEFEAIQFNARERLLRVLGLNTDEYDAFFLSGGASLQFEMLPGNYLESKQKADYINTGLWSVKAIKEAHRFGIVNVVGSSEDRKYSYIPKELRLSPEARYVHITTNNTIEGTECYQKQMLCHWWLMHHQTFWRATGIILVSHYYMQGLRRTQGRQG